MRRPKLPGLGVGGAWVNPLRSEISSSEFAYILEVPEQEVIEIFGSAVPVRAGRDFLRDLAKHGRLEEHKETTLFAGVIAGQKCIDADGAVFLAVKGRPTGRPIERRTQDMSFHRPPPQVRTWDEIEALSSKRR